MGEWARRRSSVRRGLCLLTAVIGLSLLWHASAHWVPELVEQRPASQSAPVALAHARPAPTRDPAALAAPTAAPAAASVPGPRSRAQRPGSRILVYGDSISVGEVGDFSWRYFLDQHLDATARRADLVGRRTLPVRREYTRPDAPLRYADMDFDLDSAAFWGDSLSDPKHPVEPWITRFHPDVVVVVLGLNDMGWAMVTPREALDLVTDMVRRVRAVDPTIDFVFSNITYTGYGRAPEFNAGLPGTLAALDQPGSRVLLADSHAGWRTTMSWDTDAVGDHKDPGHPNVRGEVKIAAAVSDALAELRIGTPYPRPLVFPPQPPFVQPITRYRVGANWVEVAAVRPDGTNSFDVFHQVEDGPWVQAVVNWEFGWARVGGLDPCRIHRFKVRARKFHALVDERYASEVASFTLAHRPSECPRTG